MFLLVVFPGILQVQGNGHCHILCGNFVERKDISISSLCLGVEDGKGDDVKISASLIF